MLRFELLERRRMLSANVWALQRTTGVVDTEWIEERTLAANQFDFDNDGRFERIKLNSPSAINPNSSFSVSRTLPDGAAETVSYDLGVGSTIISVGDVNNDGYLDVVSRDPMRVFVNDGAGIFDNVVLLSLPQGKGNSFGFIPRWGHIAVVDLDEDGIIDFATGTFDDLDENSVELWRGLGDGDYEFAGRFVVDGMVTDIRFADVNGDEKLDGLIIHDGTEAHHRSCDACLPGIAVALGNGEFDFDAAINVAPHSDSSLVIYEDSDADGTLEIHIADDTPLTLTFLSETDTFESEATDVDALASVKVEPRAVGVGWGPSGKWLDADFDNDGLPDWAHLYEVGEQTYFTLFWGEEQGRFHQSETRTLDASYWFMNFQAIDINNDGLLDLAATPSSFDAPWSLSNGGERMFADTPQAASTAISAREFVDLNHDQNIDVLISNARSSVQILRGDQEEPWANRETIWQLPYERVFPLGTTDLNQDGRTDLALVVTDRTGDFVVFGIQTPSGDFEESFKRPLSTNAFEYFFSAGDIDGDGRIDVVAPDAIIFGDGQGGASQTVELMHPNRPFQTEDINGDGKMDIYITDSQRSIKVAFGSAERDLSLRPLEAFRLGVSRDLSTPKIISGDINNDGLPDIVAHDLGYGLQIYLATDEGTYAAPETSYVTNGIVQQVTDLDGDGDNDLLIDGERTRTIWWNKTISNSIAGDFDSDRSLTSQDLDILWAAVGAPAPDKDRYDLNNDQQVDQDDVTYWIEQIAQSKMGDLDLDRDVDFSDFLILSSQFGKTATGWSNGNLNGDDVVDFADFLLLSSSFGFQADLNGRQAQESRLVD